MNIYLIISHFADAGGTEEPLTILGVALKKLGHRVTVFSRDAATTHNQYVRRIRESGVPVIAYPSWVVKLVSDWRLQDNVIKALLRVGFPFLMPFALLLVLSRRVSFHQAWQAASGRCQALLSHAIHQDRRDKLLLAALDWYTFFRRPDVIHVFRSELTAIFSWAERRHLTVVYSELSVPGELIDRDTWMKRSPELNKATIVTALSSATANGLQQVARISRPIMIIPPVVTQVRDIERRVTRANEVTVTCIARLSPEKGLEDLLVAASGVLQGYPEARFVIAGGGELRESLEEKAQGLGIADRILFYGLFPREDLPKIMAMTDILVLPSLTEGMGFVIIEAMAYAKPVVATAVGGIPEVVESGRTGLLVPPRDPARLAEALLALIRAPQRRENMGWAGRQKFLSGRYSEEAFVGANLKVYERACSISTSAQQADAQYGTD